MGNTNGASKIADIREHLVGTKVFFHNGISWSVGVVEDIISVESVSVKRIGSGPSKTLTLNSWDIFPLENGKDESFCLRDSAEGLNAPAYESLNNALTKKSLAYVECPQLGTLIRGLPLYLTNNGRPCKITSIWGTDEIEVESADGSRRTVRSCALSRTPVPAEDDDVVKPTRGNSGWSVSTRSSVGSQSRYLNKDRSDSDELRDELFAPDSLKPSADSTPLAKQGTGWLSRVVASSSSKSGGAASEDSLVEAIS